MPVTVRVNVPAVVELQDTVAVPEPVMVPGVIAPQVKPAGTVSVSVTTPVNPLTAVMVMVETADWPALTAAGLDAVIVKSGGAPNVNVAVAEWTSEPLVPVIVTVKTFWVVALQLRVAVPEPVTVPGVIAPQVRPAGTVSVRVTTPAKPFTAVIVIVEVAEEPAGTAAGDVAAMVKSTKLNVAVAVWTSDPLVPVTVKVKVPAVVELQDTVAVPEPVTVPGVIAPHVRPAGTVSVSVTTPAKPFTAVTVIVDTAD